MKTLLASLLLAACAHAPGAPAPAAPAAAAPAAPAAGATSAAAATTDFAKFTDAYFASVFARSPSRATRVGFHEGNDGRLEDLSRAAIEAQIADLHAQAAQIAAIRKGDLSFDDAIDAQLIDNQVHGALLDLETLRTW